MASNVQKRALSGSTDGRPIKVVATATAGTIIHTSTSTATEGTYDEVWIYANNTSASDVKLTIEFGGTTDPDDLIEKTITAEDGLVLVIPGFPLHNSLIVRSFAATGNVINISGFVNRITV